MDADRSLEKVHVSINVFIMVDSVCIFFPLAFVTKCFLTQCVLYGNVVFKEASHTSVTIDSSLSEWGQHYDCSFCTFYPVVLFIHTFIWTWFKMFSLMAKKSKSIRSSIGRHLISTLFHTMLMIMMIVVAVKVTTGSLHWCKGVRTGLQQAGLTGWSCQSTDDMYWNTYTEKGFKEPVYNFLTLTCVASWLMVLALAAKIGLNIYQMMDWYKNWTEAGHNDLSYSNEISIEDENGGI